MSLFESSTFNISQNNKERNRTDLLNKIDFNRIMVYRIDLAGLSPKSTIHDLTRRFAPCLSQGSPKLLSN